MKKLRYLFFCFFIAGGCNWSTHPIFHPIALNNSLLWQISGKGLAYPSYLYGTDHLIGGNFLDTIPYVMEKFKQCKAVAGEENIDSAILDRKSHIFLRNDSLSNLFTPGEFAEIDKTLTHYIPYPLSRFNYFKPVYVYYVLMDLILARTASGTNHQLDRYFQEEGHKLGYKVIGLETVKFHDSLLYDAPLDVQKKDLLYNLRHVYEFRIADQKAFKLYHEQNLNGLEMQINPKHESSDQQLYWSVRSRNINWSRELPAIMRQQPTFIAVGVGHLLWDCGLINQLRLKGYTVEPVTH